MRRHWGAVGQGFDPEALSQAMREHYDAMQASGGRGPEARDVARSFLSTLQQTAQGAGMSALQQGLAQAPELSLRDRGPWLDPEAWTDRTLKRAWQKARRQAVVAAFAPQAQVPAIRSVMADIAAIAVALMRVPPTTRSRATWVRQLQELASGLYGTAAEADGSGVTGYNPAGLPTPAYGGSTLAVHVVEVDGLKFDATAAAFADNVKAFASGLRSKVEDAVAAQEQQQRTTRPVAQVVREKVGTGALGAVVVIGIGAAALIWWLQRD